MITPWEVEGAVDYERLLKEFGITPFENLLSSIPNPHRLMSRGVIFGHREYERIVEAMKSGKEFAVMSGFMPSGAIHFGHKMTMDEIIWHQKIGAKAFVAIADMEAHLVRGLSYEKTEKIGMDYVKSIIALGLEKNAVVYFQSKNSNVKNLAYELSAEVNLNEMRAIYGFVGETQISKAFVSLIQSADILQPQLPDFGGPKPVVVPVGADQDPHLRLTRDLASRVNLFSIEKLNDGFRVRSKKEESLEKVTKLGFEFKKFSGHVDLLGDYEEIEKALRDLEIELGGFAFIPPSSIYHKFTTGLTGGKMSSSKPESYISLLDDPKLAIKKLRNALTGGRNTAEEQRRLGGEPEKCVVFELYVYHLVESDQELKRIEEECRSGKILCGTCKKFASELMVEFLKEHKEKRDEAEGKLGDYIVVY
ncbi:MAG: tryptophan--tRNA ligase [Archaeoglobaceae archaeon]|nr:tryptophan--tRNA ligase [Archaeoglobaceae archaeon]MDW8117710.1 tryptophan--tRNA ligase [Archaeoglobaceae archaeon]